MLIHLLYQTYGQIHIIFKNNIEKQKSLLFLTIKNELLLILLYSTLLH